MLESCGMGCAWCDDLVSGALGTGMWCAGCLRVWDEMCRPSGVWDGLYWALGVCEGCVRHWDGLPDVGEFWIE